ncbi:MAG: DNA mismatch repair protein MutS [Desulfobacteraceae bacterium IS3]|nr:MAG: DNA mismatch repair protein MutS [Desulfobacteraceae bacterium IS3]
MEPVIEIEPVIVPIEDVLDLHTFRPKEIPDLLDDYFSACIGLNIFSVRVIHGKGKGILKKRVHDILKKHPLVSSFRSAPSEDGGWGAVIVELKQE